MECQTAINESHHHQIVTPGKHLCPVSEKSRAWRRGSQLDVGISTIPCALVLEFGVYQNVIRALAIIYCLVNPGCKSPTISASYFIWGNSWEYAWGLTYRWGRGNALRSCYMGQMVCEFDHVAFPRFAFCSNQSLQAWRTYQHAKTWYDLSCGVE